MIVRVPGSRSGRPSATGRACTPGSSTRPPTASTAFDPSKGAIPQNWIVGDEDHCTAELVEFIGQYGFTDVCTWGASPGIAPSLFNSSLERLARSVIPRVREAVERV